VQRVLFSLFAALLLAAFPAASQEPAAGGADANKTLVRRYLEILSGGVLEKLDEVIAPDFVDRTPGAATQTRGPEAIRESQRRARELFQDIRYTVEDLIAEGDRVAVRYTVHATRIGAGGAGKPVEVTGVTLLRIADGRIREAWIINDQIELFRQLGYTLLPPQKP
jgi:ketosteroid isomerase-like protein